MRRAAHFGLGLIAGVGFAAVVAATLSEAEAQAAFDAPAALAIIEGELRYPSCNGTAPGLTVCASSLENDVEVCTDDFSQDEAGALTYALEVPPGRYVVFASTPLVMKGKYRAYYSEAVRCGLRAECSDHAPTPVEVGAGETVREIHPADWTAGLEPDATPLRL